MATRRVRIDFLFLDLKTCTRCRGTDQSFDLAFEALRDVLAARGTEIEVNKIHVESAEQARQLRFASSPTIRVNGHDLALELRESSCGSEARTDGCCDAIVCRVWMYQGHEYTEPPVALIIDAILHEIYGGAVAAREPDSACDELPANLERFFAGNPATPETADPEGDACCSPAEQQTCCDRRDKAECCDTASGGSCGCR